MVREVGKFGVARLESRSGAALIYTSGQDQQPGELFSRCVSYLFIGGWDRLEPILARARESGRLSSPFRLPFLAEWKAARRKSERRAEVTPAPRRSRGRAPPVRFDAFLSPPSPSAGSVSSLCHLPESFNAVLTYGWICFAQALVRRQILPTVRRPIVFSLFLDNSIDFAR